MRRMRLKHVLEGKRLGDGDESNRGGIASGRAGRKSHSAANLGQPFGDEMRHVDPGLRPERLRRGIRLLGQLLQERLYFGGFVPVWLHLQVIGEGFARLWNLAEVPG